MATASPSQPSPGLLAKIEQCEAHLAGALRGEAETDWTIWRHDLEAARASCAGDDAPLTTVLDELLALAHLAAPKIVPAASLPSGSEVEPRFGYGILATTTGDALVPTFAALLLRHGASEPQVVAEKLPGLALADHGLWRSLRDRSNREGVRALALRWLQSPARHLAWNLSVLGASQTLGVLSPERVLGAVGDPDSPRPEVDSESWPQLHACVPLRPITLDAHEATVVRALRALAAPTWFWSRAQAMSALLHRAATAPNYTVGAYPNDLRVELPGRLGAAFEVPDDDSLIELERELLRVTVTLAPDTHDDAQTFAVARWLGYVLVKSPFHPGDARVLAARLSGLRRDATLLVPRTEDGLFHPRRLLAMLGTDHERWRDFMATAGAAGHYLGGHGEPRLDPMPVPLVERLHRISARPLTTDERTQEDATSAHTRAGEARRRHLAPPWIARATLHRVRSPWIARLERDAFVDALDRVTASPQRYAWVTESLWLAARHLGPALRAELTSWWAHTEPSNLLRTHNLALAAAAAIAEVTARHGERLDDLIARCEPKWRSFVANALAIEARHAKLPEQERHFVGLLARMTDDASLSSDDRQRALGWWLQRILTERSLLTPTAKTQLQTLAEEPWVTTNPRLRLDLEGLGLGGRTRAGGTRR